MYALLVNVILQDNLAGKWIWKSEQIWTFTQLKDNIARGLHCCIYGVSNVKNIIVTEKFRLDEGVRVRGEDYLLGKKQVF